MSVEVSRCSNDAANELAPAIEARNLAVRAGRQVILKNTTFQVKAGQIFGIIGPSGGGKSTLLRCINRLNDLVPGLQVTGEAHLAGHSISSLDVNALRNRVGMLFQQPVIFPGSIRENVLFGARRLRSLTRSQQADLTESTLRETALWDEVRDRLRQPATSLSVGQQQRLCLARTLAVQPEVVLMDEPTSALDPRSTAAIEELIVRMKGRQTILIVTHNIAQARRITDWLGFVSVRDGAGELLEQGVCDGILSRPATKELAEYLKHTG